MTLNCSAVCAPGLVRTENQDNLFINGVFRNDVSDNSVFWHNDKAFARGLYAVADGMGGEARGELASLVSVQALGAFDPFGGGQSMAQYLIDRNVVICDIITNHGRMRIGSTFAGLCINGKKADIVNIGDSRVYLFRGGALSLLSRDHTSVRQMLDLGAITKEAARLHPRRHQLTQHLGIFPSEMVIEPYTASINAESNDLFLLCSDGLTDMLDDPAIEAALRSAETIENKTEALYESALQNGGKDNITILLVQVKKALHWK